MTISLHTKLELQTFKLSKHDQHVRKLRYSHYWCLKHSITSFSSNSHVMQDENFISEIIYTKSQVYINIDDTIHSLKALFYLAQSLQLQHVKLVLLKLYIMTVCHSRLKICVFCAKLKD